MAVVPGEQRAATGGGHGEPMAGPRRTDKSPHFGPRHLAAIVSAVARPALRSRTGAAAQLVADWPLIVGPTLAAATRPLRLASGALTLACAGPVALELQHLTGPLAERINAHLGRVAVDRFRFVQVQAATIAAAPRRPDAADAPPVPVAGLPEGPLRDALARLGGAVLQASLTRTPQEGA